MRKLFLLTFSVLLCCGVACAADKVLCLTLATTDGDEIYFGLDDDPVITYGDKTMTVVSTTYTIDALPLSSLEMFYFADAIPSGISTVAAAEDMAAEVTNGTVVVSGLSDGAPVQVYTAAGLLVATAYATAEGTARLDLTSLPTGAVYLLRTPSTTIKIIK